MSDPMIPCWGAAAASEKMDRSWPLGKQVRSQVDWNNNDIFAAGRYLTDTGKVIELPGAEDPMISGTSFYSEKPVEKVNVPFVRRAYPMDTRFGGVSISRT